MTKTNDIFFTAQNDINEDLIFYSTFIKAICNVMSHIETIPSEYIFDLEKVLFKLVQDLPRIPLKYQSFAIESFHEGAKYASLRTLLYQCLVHCCSFPLVTDTDSLDEGVITTKSYLPFWTAISSNKLSNDAFMQSIIDIVQKLDFQLDNFEIVRNENTGEIQTTLDSTLTQVIKEEETYYNPASCTTWKEKRPQKPKDHTILANLVVLYTHKSREEKSWQDKLLSVFIAMSTESPEVSGFYRLIVLIINDIEVTTESVSQKHQYILNYLKEVLVLCRDYDHELLAAIMNLFVKLPNAFVEPLLGHFDFILVKVFTSHHIDLMSEAIASLEKWIAFLGHKKIRPLLVKILPSMKDLLVDNHSEDLSISKIFKGKNKKRIELLQNTDMEQVQESILLLFGRLCSDLHYLLLPDEKELAVLSTAWDPDKKMNFIVPFQDLHPTIFLDNLLPRISDLCQNSKHRRTKVGASEALHVLIIYLIGDLAAHPQREYGHQLDQLFPIMLKLAGDEDSVIHNLFDKLFKQVIHWFTKPSTCNRTRSELILLLDCLIDGLENDDGTIRNTSKKMLQEFFKWSLKQNPAREANISTKLIISRIHNYWVHPLFSRRQAASMAFNSFYQQFRENDTLLDTYMMELFVQILHSLVLDHLQPFRSSGEIFFFSKIVPYPYFVHYKLVAFFLLHCNPSAMDLIFFIFIHFHEKKLMTPFATLYVSQGKNDPCSLSKAISEEYQRIFPKIQMEQ